MKYIKYSGIKKTFEGKTYGMNLLKKIKIFKKGDGNAEDVKREQRENKVGAAFFVTSCRTGETI